MPEGLRAVATVFRELQAGTGGYAAVRMMAMLMWLAKRAAALGDGKEVVDEEIVLCEKLRAQLYEARAELGDKDEVIEQLHQRNAVLEAKLLGDSYSMNGVISTGHPGPKEP